MDGTAIKAMMAEIAPVIREYVEEAQAPLLERIASLEAEKIALVIRCEALETAEKPEIDLRGVEKLIADEIAKLPEPQNIDTDEILQPLVERMTALENRPSPEVLKGDPGEDGDHVTDAFVDDDGVLILRLAKGSTIPAGQVRGKDGEDGKDAAGIVQALKDSGELVLTLQDGRLIRTGIRDGKDGVDGVPFGIDDFDCQPVDERTLKMSFVRGEVKHSFEIQFPVVVYRGVFKEGEQYERGDMTTWGGSLWHCDTPTKDKPGTESWTLAAKKGRDGKDFTPSVK